jgi:anti-sigma factor RsiW
VNAANRPVREEDLHALVDDALDPVRRSTVERYLHEYPMEAHRIAAYRMQRDALRAAFDPPASPIPPALDFLHLVEDHEARQRSVQRRLCWRAAAAIVLCAGLGGAAGWALHTSSSPLPRPQLAMSLLEQEAVASHLVYALDMRHPVDVRDEVGNELAQWLSERLSRTVFPPDLTQAGFHLIGGRLLATERGSAAAMFLYDDAGGRRLTLIMRPMAADLRVPYTELTDSRASGCAWIERGLGFALVAAMGSNEFDRMAALIQKQLSGG